MSGSIAEPSERRYRRARCLVLAAVGFLVLLTYADYGIGWDEEWQNVYGEKLLSFYLSGFTDRSAFQYRDLFYYGGAFDLVAAAVTTFSPLGEYETRHLLGGLLGIVGMIGAARLACMLAGERAAFLTVVLFALTSSLYGHMFINPKDAPFAWGLVWTSYYACRLLREAPAARAGSVIGFGIALGLTLATRIAGGVAVIYLAAAAALVMVLEARAGRPWRQLSSDAVRFAVRVSPAAIIAYAVMLMFWPWAAIDPLNPLRALHHFANVPWKGGVLIGGEIYQGTDLPAFYWPLFLAIKLPELVLAGLTLAIIQWRRLVPAEPRTIGCFAIVTLGAVFPITYAMIVRPIDFNGIRHFLFTVPPLVVLAALGLDATLRRLNELRTGFARAFAAVVAIAGGWHAWTMAELHPNQYVYFNEFVGGTGGAAGRYELDYWGNSLAEASIELGDYLARESGGKPVRGNHRFYICGYPLSALYYLPKGFSFTRDDAEAEFIISIAAPNCPHRLDGRTIVEVRRDGALLSYVRDRRSVLVSAK